MQTTAFKVFCDLAETESFTKAAHLNGVTQSAISQQISSMERQFKSLLIERSKKKFRLTREGEVLYEFSKQIMETHQALHSRLQEIKNVISGTIQLAAIYSIGLHSLPPCIQKFLKAYPGVNVHVAYRHADQVYEDVLGNVADLGLVACPWKHNHLELVMLGHEPLVLICQPQHPLAKSKTVKLRALASERFIAFASGIPTRKAIDRVFKDQEMDMHPALEFDNIETVKGAVEVGAGVAIVPQSTVLQEVAKQTLVQVPFEDVQLSRPVAVIYKKSKVLSPAMKQFLATLRANEAWREPAEQRKKP